MTISQDTIRQLTIQAINELGDKATPEEIKVFIEKELGKISPEPQVFDKKTGGRAILTAFGINHPGVVSGISSALSKYNCDIQDISQKIMQEFFTMIMLIDLTNIPAPFKDLQEELSSLAASMNIKIFLQHEDVFRQMHRI